MGNQPFRPGTPYTGNFPDPTVLRVGNVFYVASTTVGSLSLPMMTSTQPAHVDAARRAPCRRGAAWAQTKTTPGGKVFWPTWAPSLAGVVAGPLRGGLRRTPGEGRPPVHQRRPGGRRHSGRTSTGRPAR